MNPRIFYHLIAILFLPINILFAQTPTIVVSTNSLSDFGNIVTNTASSELTYTVAGSDLTDNISITASSGFEISTNSGSGFTNSPIVLTQSGGVISTTTIYVRFYPTLPQSYSGSIENTSVGASSEIISVSGTGVDPNLTVSPNNQDVTNTSGSTDFTVTSNVNWSASKNVSDTWITSVTPSGSGDGTVTVSYESNPTTSQRVGTVTISGGGITENVTVSQAAGSAVLSATPTSRSVTNISGFTTFSVTSNITWTASDDSDWLTLSGVGSGTLTAIYTANPTVSQRTGTITLSGPGVTDVTLTVVQAAGSATLTVTPSSRDVANTTGSTTFSVSSNTSWTVSDNVSWMSVSPTGGSGGGTLTASYDANTTVSARTATITVTTGGLTENVTVSQAAGSATLSKSTPTSRSVTNTSGLQTFSKFIKYNMDSK
ncbi:MAG: BACON domain-containing protein [Ignavibacteriales bacterium]|nr:BACON domain-containing protein [Ignavibacteriales bacterium]